MVTEQARVPELFRLFPRLCHSAKSAGLYWYVPSTQSSIRPGVEVADRPVLSFYDSQP